MTEEVHDQINVVNGRKSSRKRMIKRLWLKPAKRISLILSCVSLILFIMGSPLVKVNFADTVISYINSVCVGLATGIIGIIITILFV